MPTLQPGQARPESHQARAMAESFGVDAERYDRTRPPYPEAMVERVAAAAPGRDFLDVGCGTGIAARQFREAGCTVLGVEPDARMADFARRTGIAVEVATFEDWDPAGRTFDAVVAGQAWHWVDPVAGGAKAAAVLRPGGRFAAFWHVFDAPPAVGEALAAAFRRVVPDSPIALPTTPKQAQDVAQGLVARYSGGLRAAGFGEPERWQFEWAKTVTRDEWLDMLPTTGGLTRLPPDRLAEVLADVGAAIDTLGGTFTMRYTTEVLTAAR